MDSEKFCLRWNDFENNISSAFRYLRDDQDFFDVTLVCGEEQIQSHKVILSACSPFFHKILRRNPHQHPLLYMKGVRCSDMKAVLDFMYHGEVNVAQEELNSFLAVAEDLSVKGLTQNQNVKPKLHDEDTSTVNKVCSTSKKSPQILDKSQQPSPKAQGSNAQMFSPYQSSVQTVVEEIQQVEFVKAEPRDLQAPKIQATNTFVNTSVQEQPLTMYQEEEQMYEEYGDEQQYIEGDQGNTYNILPTATGEEDFEAYLKQNSAKIDRSTWSCHLCGKITNKSSHMRQHFEAFHYSLGQIQCEVCNKIFKTRHSLATHVSKHHRTQENLS